MVLFKEFFKNKDSIKKYKTYDEYLSDTFKWVEIILTQYVILINNVRKYDTALFYDKNEIEKEISYSKNENISESKVTRAYIVNKVNASAKDIFFGGEYLAKKFKLSDFEWFCVLSLIAYKINDRLKKLFKIINDFFGQESLTLDNLYKVYNFCYEINNIKSDYRVLYRARRKLQALCLDIERFEVSEGIMNFIIYNAEKKLNVNGVQIYIPSENSKPLCIREGVAENIKKFIDSSEVDDLTYIYMQGESGIGKKTIMKRVAQIQNEALVIIDISQLSINDKILFGNELITCLREAMLNSGYVAIVGADVLYNDVEKYKYNINFIFDKVGRYSRVVFIISDKDLSKSVDFIGERFLQVNLEPLSSKEGLIFWKEGFKILKNITDVNPTDMANKFNFNPKQILGTVNRAKNLYWSRSDEKIDEQEMSQCAYLQIVNTLSEKATRIKSKHTWKDLILNPKEKEMLQNACAQVKYKHIVYDKWKMNERILYGRGVSMLFAGPPGTGKTMAAGVIANELGLEIYRVDLSQIVSKYIGETEKNLNSIFNEAKKSNVILLFDETDALFGKRTEVKDSHDKNANVETSFLLQKMEEYEGITIMTTNFLQNIDSAFFRRISYVIHFEFPDKASRKKIWENMYPIGVPKSGDIDFDYLARQFEIAGGNIKNIALTSLFLAAQSKEQILNMKHILTAVKYELKKQGKTLLKEDFNEYGYMMENKGK